MADVLDDGGRLVAIREQYMRGWYGNEDSATSADVKWLINRATQLSRELIERESDAEGIPFSLPDYL